MRMLGDVGLAKPVERISGFARALARLYDPERRALRRDLPG
jgi:hypothetical protein